MKVNAPAFAAGRLAERMAQGYYAHLAALVLASDPRALEISPPVQEGHVVPVGYIKRKDGTAHAYHFVHYLKEAGSNPDVAKDLERVWLVGSLLTVGDALSQYDYFDRAPELELVRHLRNGIAHGNKFRLDNPQALLKFPAHNRLAAVRGDKKSEFEITAILSGHPVLFDFMGPGDVLDLLMSVGLYLMRLGNGDPTRP
jgi:hypothetical protein